MTFSAVAVLVASQHLMQAALCMYSGTVSYHTIKLLLRYKKKFEKVAEWSPSAEMRLRRTRSTQMAGAAAIFVSLIASLLLAFFGTLLPRWLTFGLSPFMLIFVLLARGHVKHFWIPGKGKTAATRIPLPHMGAYNEAQRQIQKLLKLMEYLEYSWVLASFVNAMLLH